MRPEANHSREQRPAGAGSDPAMSSPPPPLEWLLAAVGLVLLLASVGYLLFDAWDGRGAAPAPQVRVTAIEPQQGRFLVRFRVSNESRTPAANLRVVGELRRGEELVESSETEFAFVPGRSWREGGLFFARDPRTLRLELGARSYQAP